MAGRGAAREMQFVFPRDPALASDNLNKPISFDFEHPDQLAGERRQRMLFRFQTSEMKVADKIVY